MISRTKQDQVRYPFIVLVFLNAVAGALIGPLSLAGPAILAEPERISTLLSQLFSRKNALVIGACFIATMIAAPFFLRFLEKEAKLVRAPLYGMAFAIFSAFLATVMTSIAVATAADPDQFYKLRLVLSVFGGVAVSPAIVSL